MGVIDEVKPSDSNKDKPSLHPNPSLSSSKNDDAGEVSLPQMLITSAEDVNEEIELGVKEQNLADEKSVLTTIKEENEDEKEIKDKKDASSAQQRPLVISAHSEIPHETVEELPFEQDKQLPRTESPPLSAVQRPLVFEQVPLHSETVGVQETQQKSFPEHALGTSPTAIQRPLVVDGSCGSFDSSERGISGLSQSEIYIDITEQNGALGFIEPSSSPAVNSGDTEENSYGNKENITSHDAHKPEVCTTTVQEAAPVGRVDSPTSKLKGFFAKADGTPIFSLPKFNIGSSKEHNEPPKEENDAAQKQATRDEIHADSENLSCSDKNVKDQVKDDGKTMFSLPKFSFGSSKEHKHVSKEHKDSTHSPGSSPDIHPDSVEAIAGMNEKKHTKEVTFSLPKFGFASSKENKEISIKEHDSSLNQITNVENCPSPTDVTNLENHSADSVKEGSKVGFSLSKFNFGFSKEPKEISKDPQDGSPSHCVPAGNSANTVENINPEAIVKDDGKHTFQFPKFSFGSSKEQKETLKEQKSVSPVHTIESKTDSSEVMVLDSDAKDRIQDTSKSIFSLPKFGFGIPKEHKESPKETKDVSHMQSISSENRPISIEVTVVDVNAKDVTKEDSKHSFGFPKFGFGSPKSCKKTTKEPIETVEDLKSTDDSKVGVEANDNTKEGGKHAFSFPKFSFGSSKEDEISKEPKDPFQSQTISVENQPHSSKVAMSDAEAKLGMEDSKHSFSFPKFNFSSSKEEKEVTKQPKDNTQTETTTTENYPVSPGSAEDSKHSFSFPKFNFSSSKEQKENTKQPKDNTQTETTTMENYPVSPGSAEDSKHSFSFPKFSFSSSKEHKENTKQPKDNTQTSTTTTENYPVSTGSTDTTPTGVKDNAKGESKSFSFPKIGFGSFREHREIAKEQKDTVSHESHPRFAISKGSGTGSKVSFQNPEPFALNEEDSKSWEAKKHSKSGAPLAAEEKDPFNKAKNHKLVPERKSSFKMKKESKEVGEETKSGENPSSLYETCCMRLAGMICNKAMEIVSEHSSKHGPPRKPPKPSAEAIAKARAAIVAKRVQEYEKRRNFGDEIPLGYNGIRFVDDDTESSTDYKDVDNTAYIIDSDCSAIVRKMKSENALETFSCPSTCSGMSSYYTADEMTLKDGNFSDYTLESISLGSQDSLVYKPALSTSSEEHKISTGVRQIDHQKPANVKKPVEKQKSSPASFSFFSRNKNTVSSPEISKPIVHKRVPPPIPPKPCILPSSENLQKVEPTKPEIQKCVDSLSLSPRPLTRSHSSTSGIRK